MKEVRSFLSKLMVTNLGFVYQFDIEVLKQLALVDSMRSSSESFQVFFFFFRDSSSVRLIQHQFGAMPRAPGASIFRGMSFRLIEHLSWSNYSDLTPKCS